MAKVALLVVDVQYDFLPPDGALAVDKGDEILPVVYRLLENDRWASVVMSEDFHPPQHISFASTHSKETFKPISVPAPWKGGDQEIEQMLWPDHCVQGTKGCQTEAGVAQRVDRWSQRGQSYTIRKGTNPKVDAYSAFATQTAPNPTSADPSPLTAYLRSKGITTLAVVGLATDYCVISSAKGAIQEGFEVWWVKDGSRATGGPDAAKAAEAEVVKLGGKLMTEEEVLKAL